MAALATSADTGIADTSPATEASMKTSARNEAKAMNNMLGNDKPGDVRCDGLAAALDRTWLARAGSNAPLVRAAKPMLCFVDERKLEPPHWSAIKTLLLGRFSRFSILVKVIACVTISTLASPKIKSAWSRPKERVLLLLL